MPPEASGIAVYNQQLVVELQARCALEVLSPADASTSTRLASGEHDVILYTVGNSAHHVHTPELVRRFPGVVWLHDARLTDLYREIAKRVAPSAPARWLRERLVAQYGEQLAPSSGTDLLNTLWWHRENLFLCREMVRTARGVVVSTRAAERIVRADLGPSPAPAMLRLPLAVPRPPFPVGSHRVTDPPLVATFGQVHSAKAPDRLIKAIAAVAKRTDVQLAFVGGVHAQFRAELTADIRRLRLRRRVRFLGAVNTALWWGLVGGASVAVQLRRTSNGESSGAIACAQAAGTPVITNIADADQEYPSDAVRAVNLESGEPELEAALLELLVDRREWDRYSHGGLAHAHCHTFALTADRLLEWLQAERR